MATKKNDSSEKRATLDQLVEIGAMMRDGRIDRKQAQAIIERSTDSEQQRKKNWRDHRMFMGRLAERMAAARNDGGLWVLYTDALTDYEMSVVPEIIPHLREELLLTVITGAGLSWIPIEKAVERLGALKTPKAQAMLVRALVYACISPKKLESLELAAEIVSQLQPDLLDQTWGLRGQFDVEELFDCVRDTTEFLYTLLLEPVHADSLLAEVVQEKSWAWKSYKSQLAGYFAGHREKGMTEGACLRAVFDERDRIDLPNVLRSLQVFGCFEEDGVLTALQGFPEVTKLLKELGVL